ncbi:porin family protein [Shewanella sp. A25]|nr:porin family protein [Shewanella shenzhenensis]
MNIKYKILLLSLMSVMFSAQASEYSTRADQQKQGKPWYVGGSIGWADSSASLGEMNRRFTATGMNAVATEVDDKDTAYDVRIGYAFDRHWSLEVGYKDLGEVLVRFTGRYQDADAFFDAVEHVHPESGEGYFIAGNYHYYFTDEIAVYGKLGYFDWEGKYVTTDVGDPVGHDKMKGNTWFYGLGLQYDLSKDWAVDAKWEQFDFDNDTTNVFSVGVVYRFK